jgi:hypothetical protein
MEFFGILFFLCIAGMLACIFCMAFRSAIKAVQGIDRSRCIQDALVFTGLGITVIGCIGYALFFMP